MAHAPQSDEAISFDALEKPASDPAARASYGPPNGLGRQTGILAIASSLAACGGGDSASSASVAISPPQPGPAPSPSPTPANSVSREDASAARFLMRATFSASRGAIDAVKKEGREAWLDRHSRQANDQSAKGFFERQKIDEVNADRNFATDRFIEPMIWAQLMYGGNSYRKRIALALSEFFVVSSKPRLRIWWASQAVGQFWDKLNENAFGNFRTLLKDVCLSPAMGTYLDTIGSKKEDTRSGRVPDENFAREVMQLFSIGLVELNIDGSPKLVGGEQIETYTNEDVVGLARAFTGYDLDVSGLSPVFDPQNSNRQIPPVEAVRRPLTANPSKWPIPANDSQHSLKEKAFLGTRIPPGTGPEKSLEIAIDTLFEHPNVGPFFGKQMIQRLVTSNPSPEYVTRVARAFNNNGEGVRGDLGHVFKTILLDPEANSEATLNDLRFGKLREPMVRLVQFARTFDLYTSNEPGITRALDDNRFAFSQSPFSAPSVFNFFRPTYIPPLSTAGANNMVAPEFQLVDETSIAGYLNALIALVDGKIHWLNGLEPNYDREIGLAEDPDRLIQELDLLLTGGQLQEATRSAIASAVKSISSSSADTEAMLRRVKSSVALIMASNDYLVQK